MFRVSFTRFFTMLRFSIDPKGGLLAGRKGSSMSAWGAQSGHLPDAEFSERSVRR